MAKPTLHPILRWMLLVVMLTAMLAALTAPAALASPGLAQSPPVVLPMPDDVQAVARRVNDYWIANRTEPEDNNWSRGTYFTGDLAHYAMSGDSAYLDEAWQWAEAFDWQLNGGCATVYAENHTAAQTYLALYTIDPLRADIACVRQAIETSISWGWVEVDLGAAITINRVHVDTFQDRAYRYLVDTKLAAGDPYTMTLDRSDGKIGESTFAPTTARYVRLRVIGAQGYDDLRVSLNEFQVYGDANPATNLALGKDGICSSVAEPENGCVNLFDGNPESAWSALIPEDFSIESPKWWWVDALYVAMPVYAMLDTLERTGELPPTGYASALYAKYDEAGMQRGLWDADAALWYRDLRFVTMHSPNGKRVFWSRGNGWAFAALARTLDLLPAGDPHYAEYLATFQAMAAALIARQDVAGYWPQNLDDPNHCGGPESSGTAFFVYGLAWGINHHHLDRATYMPPTVKAWRWLVDSAVQDTPAGLFGYVQPVGDSPRCDDAAPLPTATDTADFGVGAFLLAASEAVDLSTSGAFDSTLHLPLLAR